LQFPPNAISITRNLIIDGGSIFTLRLIKISAAISVPIACPPPPPDVYTHWHFKN
jgi:hypothetical protein